MRSIAGIREIAYAKGSIAAVATTALDFGTPNDVKLTDFLEHGERCLVVLKNTTAGTTDTTSWTVQDADDNAGSIGTPATAVTTVVTGTALSGGTGDKRSVVEVTVNKNRPWLRVNMVRGAGTTDTTVVTATVYAVAWRV
jgi:hypothetical protein